MSAYYTKQYYTILYYAAISNKIFEYYSTQQRRTFRLADHDPGDIDTSLKRHMPSQHEAAERATSQSIQTTPDTTRQNDITSKPARSMLLPYALSSTHTCRLSDSILATSLDRMWPFNSGNIFRANDGLVMHCIGGQMLHTIPYHLYIILICLHAVYGSITTVHILDQEWHLH